MGKVIGVAQQKGGVSKTTLALNIAGYLASNKNKVLLIDADNQGTALDWQAVREDDLLFNIVGIPRDTLHKEVSSLKENYDYVVLDSPPHNSGILRSIILASDFLLIPVTPSAADVWAASETVQLFEEGKVFKEDANAAFVISKKLAKASITSDVMEVLNDYNLPILNSSIGQRVAFAEAISAGKTVFELSAKSPASKEIETLVKEIISWF